MIAGKLTTRLLALALFVLAMPHDLPDLGFDS